MTKQTRGYEVSAIKVVDSGMQYALIGVLGHAAITIPNNATMHPHPETSESVWYWSDDITGANVQWQLHAGNTDVKAGDTVVCQVEAKEKQLPKVKGGYQFLYLKLVPAAAQPDIEVFVMNGTRFDITRDEFAQNAEARFIEAPQKRHQGGIVSLPLTAKAASEAA